MYKKIRKGYQGINEPNKMSKLHDQFYNENTDTKMRNISDIALAHRARETASDPRIMKFKKNMQSSLPI